MNVHYIKTPEKRRLVEQLNKQFGLSNVPYLLIESGKEKIRAFSGSVSKEEIKEISEILNIEVIGLYFMKKEIDLRLSMDAIHLMQNQISNNVVEINEEQFNIWIRGGDLDIKTGSGTFIIKYGDDFIGSGKSNGEKIINHVPKERRLKR